MLFSYPVLGRKHSADKRCLCSQLGNELVESLRIHHFILHVHNVHRENKNTIAVAADHVM